MVLSRLLVSGMPVSDLLFLLMGLSHLHTYMFLLMYVDINSSIAADHRFGSALSTDFVVKDLGKLHFFS
jgi:hypothetical protein